MSELLKTTRECISLDQFYPLHHLDKAQNMVKVLDAYLRTFSWKAIIKAKLCCRKTLWSYMQCPMFIRAIDSMRLLATKEAESKIQDLIHTGPPDVQLKASRFWLEAHDPATYNPRVVQERYRAGANMATTLLKLAVDKQREILKRDPDIVQVGAEPAITISIPDTNSEEEGGHGE